MTEDDRPDSVVPPPDPERSSDDAPDPSRLDASLEREGSALRAVPVDGADRPYRVLVEAMADAALIVAGDGRVLYQNASTRLLTGRQLVGRRLSEAFVAEDRSSVGVELLSTGGIAEGELEHARGHGVSVRISVRAMTLDGATRHAVVLHDLSERELRVASEAASAAKSDFLGVLGHEIRNPLASLDAALELLDGEPDIETLVSTRSIMQRQVRHIEALVGDLLDTARIERGKLSVARQPLELGALLGEAVEGARLSNGASGVDIVDRRAAEPVWIDGDPVRLRQVFENLLRNAVEASDGRGRVTLTSVLVDADTVRVDVDDQGCGITADELTRILQPFEQGRSGREGSRGLGVGLALVRGLLERLGGTLSVHSDGRGQGATFSVRLQRRAAPSATPAAEDAEADVVRPTRERTLKVLLVDDHRDTREVLEKLLRRAGHSVTLAANAVEARRTLAGREFAFDVLLTDVHLPDEDGIELGRSVREHGFSGALVALTGRAEEAIVQRVVDAGFAAHLAKPVRLTSLLDCLRQVTEAAPGRHASEAARS